MQFGGDKDGFVGNDADGSGSGGELLVELTITILVISTSISTNTVLAKVIKMLCYCLLIKTDKKDNNSH